MLYTADPVLDLPFDAQPDPDELVQAAMAWHFNPETGSRFWLARAKSLGFDPRQDVKSLVDLALFPNVANELRNLPVEDLIPQGYGPNPDLIGVFESGGTTGAPKPVAYLRDWWERALDWSNADMDARGVPRNVNWLGLVPTGPHMVGEFAAQVAMSRGGLRFSIDLDPRWVRKLIAAGKREEAGAYAEHLVDQAAHVLRTQRIGALFITPPLLERLARRDELVALINESVRSITWSGVQMDADTRHLFRTEVFPGVALYGGYGSTLILGAAFERPGLTDDSPCVFDPFAPYTTFRVVDPATGEQVPHGERGQVVMSHVSKSTLLPNNLERDLAERVEPPPGAAGDSVADVAPIGSFDDEVVIDGVY